MHEKLEFADGTIVIQPLRPADAVDHLDGEDPELVRWLNGGPGTLDTVTSYLAAVERRWAAGGPTLSFAIRSATNHTLGGTLDIHFGQEFVPDTHANLAYGLYPTYRGRGLATRSVLLALTFLRNHTALTDALIRTDLDNVRSAAVALRAGFALTQPARDTPDGHDWYERPVA